VREICTHGSEGGALGLTGPLYPYRMPVSETLAHRGGTGLPPHHGRLTISPWPRDANPITTSSGVLAESSRTEPSAIPTCAPPG